MKAVWTREAQDDLRAWHNLDAEGELAVMLAREINAEIDRETVIDLRTARDMANFPSPQPSHDYRFRYSIEQARRERELRQRRRPEKDKINWKKEGF
jgi:hypothetical protein